MRPSASFSFFRIPAPPYCRKPIEALGPTSAPFWRRFALNARSRMDLWVSGTVALWLCRLADGKASVSHLRGAFGQFRLNEYTEKTRHWESRHG